MRPEKTAIAEELRDRLQAAAFAIVAEFGGLNAVESNDLRARLREAGCRLQVVRNTALARAAAEAGVAMDPVVLTGPSAAVTGSGDVAAAIKVLKKFIAERQKLKLKGGMLDRRFITAADIDVLAELPDRQEMVARVARTVAGPLARLAGVMNQKVLTLLYALKAVAETKGSQESK